MPDRHAFQEKLSKLAETKAIDDSVFADMVYTAMSEFGLDDQTFRDAFGLSGGAVERWTQRQNLPQPIVRPKIILWIRDNLP